MLCLIGVCVSAWSGSGILGVKWIKHTTSNLLSTLCKMSFGMTTISGKGQTQLLIQAPEKERKGWGRSGVSRGAITTCRSNTTKQQHDCSNTMPTRSKVTSLGPGKAVKVTTRAMHVHFWTHRQTGIGKGQFACDQLLLCCVSDEEHNHTQKSTPSPHSLESQFATGVGKWSSREE